MAESSGAWYLDRAKWADRVFQSGLPPRERLVTLPAGVPEYTLGYECATWIAQNIRVGSGKFAGEPFRLSDDQFRFVLWFYGFDPERWDGWNNPWLYQRGVRRLAKGPIAHDTPVVTPDGVRRHGDLRVGDRVYAVDGSITTVVGLGDEVREDTYRVFFRGGGSVVCTGSHRWPVDVFVGRSRRVRRVVTVREMVETGLMFDRALTSGRTKASRGSVSRYRVLPTPAVEGDAIETWIDPWLFGMWLGDGDSDSPRLTVGVNELAWVESELDRLGVEHSRARTGSGWRVRFGRGWAVQALRAEGVFGSGLKRIPERWFGASLGQRWALLQGLVDSDGSVDKHGSVEYCSMNLALGEDVARLCRSLGLMPRVHVNAATLRGRVVGKRVRVTFTPLPGEVVCRMPRKAERVRTQRVHNVAFSRVRVVERIEPVETVPARCITVAHDSHQYLVGEHMIPTCNSGKSPFAAALTLFELLGPCRVGDVVDPKIVPGGVFGKPQALPLIQLAAVSENQTGVTMRQIVAMAHKGTRLNRDYNLETGRTQVLTPEGGKIQLLTSSWASAEGGEPSLVIADEVEHWVPAGGGVEFHQTLVRNLGKTGSRMIETCNAWVPGRDSVAEKSFEDWCLQEEGKLVEAGTVLYDARVAPPGTVMTDTPEEGEIGLSEALGFVYEEQPWVDISPIRSTVWTPSTPVSVSRRFYLNQPNVAEDSWVTLQQWSSMADTSRELVDGEDVVLFFDGSKSNDHTALVGCCMSDGHVFTVGVWRPGELSGEIDVNVVDSAVRRAYERFNVVAFWADVREWEAFVKVSWPEVFADSLLVPAVRSGKAAALIAWDMRTHVYDFALASEMCRAEIEDSLFTHDGNWETSRHIGNARMTERKGLITIKKESPKSPNKIDAAVCVIGARMVYRAVLASAEWEKRSGAGKDWVVFT